MKVHVLGLAHSPISRESVRDAFSIKAFNLCRMLRAHGHHVTLYGCAGSDASIADEFVEVVSQADYEACYGQVDKVTYQFDSGSGWAGDDEAWRKFALATAYELDRRIGKDAPEIICATLAWAQKSALDKLPRKAIVVESGIGYSPTTFADRVFESDCWRATILAQESKDRASPGKRDVVIPNAFDADWFEYREKKGDYFLFLARVNPSKGVTFALDACREAGVKLKVVGQLPHGDAGKTALAEIQDKGAEYLPSVGLDGRKELLAGARALLSPTVYVEPFGGVTVEAGFSGTPVIATAWGAFPEIIEHGVTGWLCHSRDDMVEAIRRIDEIQPAACRSRVMARYTLDRVGRMYDYHLRRVVALSGGPKCPVDLDWMRPSPDPSTGLPSHGDIPSGLCSRTVQADCPTSCR